MSDAPLPDLSKPGRAHFVGAGGVGMAGVALLLRRLGWEVSGCDGSRAPLLDWLEARGIHAVAGHDPAHLDPRPDLVVRTPAVHDDNPELAAARAAGVPVVARGDALAALSARYETYAVCGSHGKTTTSTFLATILRSERPADTLWCIGGASAALGGDVAGGDGPAERSHGHTVTPSNGHAVEPLDRVAVGPCDRVTQEAAPPLLVAEADESDGTLARYSPAVTVLTNLDLDHVDRFPSVAAFERVFLDCIARTSRALVFGIDHPRAAAVAAASRHPHRVSFGFSPAAKWRLVSCEPDGAGTRSVLRTPDGAELPLRLPVPGRHNALNAAAAIAAAAEAGVAPERAVAALERSASLPARRFERIGAPEGFAVVSDYSHHPSEIRALVATARGVPHRRIVAVFQPHRYTRTRTFLEDFPPAFRGVDDLVLCPVYAASESPIPGGTSADLYAAFRSAAAAAARNAAGSSGRVVERSSGPSSPPSDHQTTRPPEHQTGSAAEPPPIPVPVFAESLDDAFDYLAATIREGDLVLVVGAGDVNALAPRLAAVRPAPEPPPVLLLSAYGTRAPAPGFRIAASLDALRAALAEARAAGTALRVLGAGTNTLVAATGVHGPVARLRGPDFDFIRDLPSTEEHGEDADTRHSSLVTRHFLLEVGAATTGTRLLAHCRAHGLSGLEALVDIPGTVGGWLAMNAGTRFGSFCDRVESVRALGPDGAERTLGPDDLRATYRACPGLAGLVAVSVTLRLSPLPQEEIAARMKELSEKRLSFAGLRTCGSVFKNPPAPSPTAGQLSDRAFCKGLRVGGAHVAARHGNVISADGTATPSDVQALLHLVADRVFASSGVLLEPELRILR